MRSEKGFTLTELLVVIAIMAVLAMVTIPTVGPMFRDHALDSSISNVQGVFLKARSLAAIHNSIYYVSFNTLPANGKRTQDFMIIYSSQYWDTSSSSLLPLDKEKWNDYWDNTGVSPFSSDKEARKNLVASPPVYLEKNTCLGLTDGAYGKYTSGNDRRSFIAVHPSGEIEFGGTFASDTTSDKGRNVAIKLPDTDTTDSYANDYDKYINQYGVLLLYVLDLSDDPSRSATDIDSDIDRRIGSILLTGDFFDAN